MELDFDVQGIMEMLPHRYPFLLVDRVIKLIPDDRIVAIKNVTINEPFFQGHFPGKPLMPGVLIIEAMAQAGGILAYQTAPAEKRNRLIYFMGMDKVRFRKMVVPGDQIIFEAKIIKFRTKVAKMSGTATVDDQLVAEAELMASFGDVK
ncbi:MAG: 3-hydroxyacyl-ACP dehydratase FabZ [Desulfobacterales bacterium]|nr:3-hydroxyacyl-ACP dehydratase FabZ [Desulfobacterales bacterium]